MVRMNGCDCRTNNRNSQGNPSSSSAPVNLIENDESEDYPEEKLRDTGMRFWYRELAVYDTTRAKLSADSIEVTLNLLVFGGKKTLPFIHLENVLLISLIAFMD